jgi:carboxymethylenebutenolidase
MTATNGAWIAFAAPGGDARAFAVEPAGPPPWPALIVIHGASGLDQHHEAVTAGFAAQGYFAVAPDIYSHDAVYRTLDVADIEAGMVIGPHRYDPETYLAQFPAERRANILRAHHWVEHRPDKTYITPVRACFDSLKTRRDVGTIGALGYCMGGRLVAELAATGADLAAGVIFYGIDPGPAAIPRIRCPLQGHYGVTDTRITGRVPEFAAAMKAAGKAFTFFIYEAGHGFANAPHLASYNAAAARLANERADAFLAAHLKEAVPNPAGG